MKVSLLDMCVYMCCLRAHNSLCEVTVVCWSDV